MGPMKDGRGVLWSCLLRTSISEDANDASSLLQSRSMDISRGGCCHLRSHVRLHPTNDGLKCKMIYIVQMKRFITIYQYVYADSI